MSEDLLAKAARIVSGRSAHGATEPGAVHCVLALLDPDGTPVGSVISPSRTYTLEWLTFCTGLNTPKVERVRHCGRGSACFYSDDYSITLTGGIEVVTDPAVKKEMWYPDLKDHFSGPEDPEYCVLRLKTDRYSLFLDWQELRGLLDK